MKRTLLLLAAVAAGALAAVAGPALSASPYRPDPVDFEVAAPAAKPTAARGDHDYVSPPLRAPKRFNLVGLRWRGSADHAHLRVRVKDSRGRWSPWRELHTGAAEGPDPGRGEPVKVAASAPAWAGQADWVQYRAERRLPGAKLHFVNTTGTATAADRRRTAIRRTINRGVVGLAKLPGALVPNARAAEPQPPIVPRAQWGAQDCPPRSGPDYGQVKAAFVHHTVNLNDYSQAEAPAVVLGICRYHRNSNGWNDVGYNFLVDKYGTIYEGRAGGVDQPIVGAQAQGYNSQSTGIANVGTFEDVPQSNEALTAMARLIRWKLPLHGVPTQGNVTVTSAGGDSNRYPAGTSVTLNRISGHRDGNNTACPGTALYNQLPDLRARVGAVDPGVPQGGASGPSRFGTKVHMATPRARTLVYGQPAQLSGNLIQYGGAAVADVPVELQRQTSARTFKTIARTTTGDGGGFTLSFVPSKRAVVRVAFPGDTTHRTSQSKITTIQVRPNLTFAKPPSRVRTRTLVTVPGSIAPRKGSVRLIVERRSGRGKKGRIATIRARASRGPFKARIRLRSNGLYRMYLVYPGDRNNLSARGKSFLVRVARRGATSTPTQPPSTGGGGGTAPPSG
jgi:hypothetical protein